VLLVTSSARPDHWIVPGGGVEPDEEPRVTALREVREEAGVVGQLGRCLGVFEVPPAPSSMADPLSPSLSFQNEERKHRTEVFVMTVTEELAEWEDSKNIGMRLILAFGAQNLPSKLSKVNFAFANEKVKLINVSL